MKIKRQMLKYTVADPEGVPWNPAFEELPSKLLCANVLLTLCIHWSYALTIAITHACQLNFVYHEFDAHMAYILVIKRASELKERFYSCISPSAARDGDKLSV